MSVQYGKPSGKDKTSDVTVQHYCKQMSLCVMLTDKCAPTDEDGNTENRIIS
jgi:hypothetical protein